MKKLTLIGHLGRDPEMKYLPSGVAVTNFSVAGSGYDRTKSEWFNCSAFGKLGELCNQWLTKGRQVYLEGELSSRAYETQGGEHRYALDINVSDIQFLGSGGSDEPATTDLSELDDILN